MATYTLLTDDEIEKIQIHHRLSKPNSKALGARVLSMLQQCY